MKNTDIITSNVSQTHNEYIKISGLWKIFGHNPRRIFKRDLQKASRNEIREKTGHVLAIREVSFQVRKGEFFVVMGLSGSGKSTLIRCLLRLIEPTAGEIIIEGENICQYKEKKLRELRRNKIAMVFQHFGLLPHQTVLDNVAYGLRIRGVKKKERYLLAQGAITKVGLDGWEKYLPSALSGGMQQRVGIARALANNPDILLMDEPFSGLDPLIRRQMQDELLNLQSELHKTIIFVTHDLNEAIKLGNRIAIMKDGDIIQIGTPAEVVTAPADDYVREFVRDASLGKVVTASNIMKQPMVTLYEWQDPDTAIQILENNHVEEAFVLSRSGKFIGMAHIGVLNQNRQRQSTINGIIQTNLITCSPDTVLDKLLPLTAGNKRPIPIVDEQNYFLGEVAQSDLMLMMQEDKPSNNGKPSLNKPEPAKKENEYV